jgi:Tol biopolymer transport system component
MPLSPGDKLGPYEILSPLGAGGMGEVYKARDTRLGRDVALKISNEKFNDRFEREAKSIASLNHPNICQLYDVGPDYLVMELIDGEPIKGPLPLATALEYAGRIADALQAAHDRGIIHRDLKPANIMLTSGGVVKVLDFGLAKNAEAAESDPESSPTMTISPTRAGMIVGTAAYMAPEQARGKSVDKRADIWAFGVVLYEILTGKKLFQGETVSDILASVLKEEPDLSRVPAEVRHLLGSCLQKDPRRRLRDIGDMPLLLNGDAPTRTSGALRWILPSIAAALVLVLVIAVVTLRQPAPAAPLPVQFQISPPEKSLFGPQMALSPDGRMLAFTDGSNSIWVRPLDALQARQLRQAHATQPFFWSPDSRFIVYNGNGKLTKIDVSGGPPQVLCDAPGGVIGGFWTKDGTIAFGQNAGPMMTVPASGGVPSRIAKVDASATQAPLTQMLPSLLPDGRHFIHYTNPGVQDVVLTSFDAKPGSEKVLVNAPVAAVFAPSSDSKFGYLLFLRDSTLVAQPFDLSSLALTGAAAPVAEGVGTSLAHGFFTVSGNGVLAYRTGSAAGIRLVWFDRTGRETGSVGQPGDYRNLALSPDGSRVATARVEAMNQDIWLLDLARNTNTRLTSDPAADAAPVWSRDGNRVAWTSGSGANRRLFMTLADGDSKPEMLLPATLGLSPWDWSSDGRLVYSISADPRTQVRSLWTVAVDGDRKPSRVTQSEFSESHAQFSPDGRWISYTSDESGRPEIYVRPFPSAPERGGKIKVSEGGGASARWRRDGKELFYIAGDQKMMAVDVNSAGGFKAGVPQPLFQSRMVGEAGRSLQAPYLWDVSADGKRFLIGTPAAESSEAITVVLNWQAALKK